ncbi:MAG: ATP-binding cassette domain-containing protein [Oscillospiraceae bacterium]
METYRIEHLTFSYPNQREKALDDLSLTVEAGEFITLCGPSGCGKTTLLRQLKTVLAPHGEKSGAIFFQNTPLEELDGRVQSKDIGFVLQSPENQIVTDKVWHELAFGLESLGYDTPTIRLRVAEMASFFGIQTWFYKNVTELSGGQKQLLNLAAVMAMQPGVLILDEPTSQLDPIAAADFLATVGKINRELGTTVILTEHRLEAAFSLSDRCIVMDGGRIIADAPPREAGELLRNRGHKMFLAMPTPMRIWAGVETALSCPITVREGRDWIGAFSEKHGLQPVPQHRAPLSEESPAIELRGVWFRYEKELPDVLKGLSLTVPRGSFFALVGGNGTGKTTTLSLISGIKKPHRGEVLVDGRPLNQIPDSEKFGGLLGVLPQNPQALFVKKTVELDLYEMLSEKRLTAEEKRVKVEAVTRLCQLESLLTRHPYDLSGGEQQRAALAKVLLLEPQILLLDEPTKGIDSYFKEKLAKILKRLQAGGTTILMVSHDIEFCASYADRCAMCFDGAIVTQGEPHSFFSGNNFYTTAANRMVRHLLPDAVTVEDVIAACGGTVPEPEVFPPSDFVLTPAPKPDTPKKPAPNAPLLQTPTEQRKLSHRTVAAALMILLLIPLTIFVGMFYLDNRKYYFISMLVILETFLPFFLVFEGRKPQARELVVVAVLCAIAVAGRAAFFMVPQFKPVAAIVIIAAVALGGETGFIVGAVSMFVSNMFFGQGPLTPWQMFAMGLIGFLAGVLFQKGVLRRSKPALCIFGFCATLLLYGGIMNPATLLMAQENPTLPMFLSSYLMGLPFDLIHGVATAFFLWVAGPAFLEKLDRIKEKYGLLRT